MKCQFGTSNGNGTENGYGGRRTLPYVFTEQGISMLASVLHSKVAINVSIGKEKFIEKMKQFGCNVNWTEKRKHITFQNQDGKKVRDSNLSKTFHLHISKEGLENEFNGNRQKSRVAADRDSRADEELRNYYRELDAAIADTRGITNQAQSGEGYSRTEFRESERVVSYDSISVYEL